MEFKTILALRLVLFILAGLGFCLSAAGKSEMERRLHGERTFEQRLFVFSRRLAICPAIC